MQRRVIKQLARAGHICGAPVGSRFCLRPPAHGEECSAAHEAFESSPVMRERVRRARAVVHHESAERRVASLLRRCERLEERRAWTEQFIGFRIEYRLRGGYRRLRRYWRFAWHRTLGRRAWLRRVA